MHTILNCAPAVPVSTSSRPDVVVIGSRPCRLRWTGTVPDRFLPGCLAAVRPAGPADLTEHDYLPWA